MKVSCPKCKKIHKDVDKDTAIYCSCKCVFGLDKNNKPKILIFEHQD